MKKILYSLLALLIWTVIPMVSFADVFDQLSPASLELIENHYLNLEDSVSRSHFASRFFGADVRVVEPVNFPDQMGNVLWVENNQSGGFLYRFHEYIVLSPDDTRNLSEISHNWPTFYFVNGEVGVLETKALGPISQAQPRPQDCVEGTMTERLFVDVWTTTIRDWCAQRPHGCYESRTSTKVIAEIQGSFSGVLFFPDPNPTAVCDNCHESVPGDGEIYHGSGGGAFMDWTQPTRSYRLAWQSDNPLSSPTLGNPWTITSIEMAHDHTWSSGFASARATQSTIDPLAAFYVTPSSSFTCYVWGDTTGDDGGGGGGGQPPGGY